MVTISRSMWKTRNGLKAVQGEKRSSTDTWGQALLVLILLAWATSFFLGFETALTVLTLIGFALAVIGLRFPFVGLFGIGFLSTLDPLTRVYLLTGGLFRWNTFNYLLLLVILLALPFIFRLNDPHSRILQIFIVLIGLELFISTDPSAGIQDILNMIAIFGMLVYFARNLQDNAAFFWLSMLSGTLAAAGGLVFFLLSDQLDYIDPNAWGLFPLTALFAICFGFRYADRYRNGRFVLSALATVNLVLLFLSGSRGNLLIGLCCLLFLFGALRSLKWWIFMVVSLLAIGSVISLQFVTEQTNALHRLQKSFDTSYSLSSRTSGRSLLLEGGLRIIMEHPLGIGTGGFRWEFSKLGVWEDRAAPAHSAWIKVLAENGFPGFILLAAYVVSFAYVGWRSGQRDLFLIGILVTISFAVGFISREFQGKSLWFLAVGGTVFLHQKEMANYLQGSAKLKPARRGWRSRNTISYAADGSAADEQKQWRAKHASRLGIIKSRYSSREKRRSFRNFRGYG